MTAVVRHGDSILLAFPVGIGVQGSDATIEMVANSLPGVRVLGGSSGILEHIVYRPQGENHAG